MPYNILAGVILTVFSIILVKLFASGNSLGYVLPMYGTAIIVGALLGYVFLKEKVSLLQVTGIALTAVGISLVALSKR